MRIALIHYRVGETDGVSLEMDKWKKVLEKDGHQVIYIAGNEGIPNTIVIEELQYTNQEDVMITKNCFESLADYDENTLVRTIETRANLIKNRFVHIINQHRIDMVIPNNIFSLGKSIPIALGLYRAIMNTNVKVLAHHHDFYWERSYYNNPTIPYVKEALETLFPPLDSNWKHAVINTIAKKDLVEKKHLQSSVVPNVFDFETHQWCLDEYNADFRTKLGINKGDIMFLQATRVVNRKAIELAIDLVSGMNALHHHQSFTSKRLYDGRRFNETSKMVLVLVGLHEGVNEYEKKLIDYAEIKQVRMIMDPNIVGHSRKHVGANKIYSLWDAYVHADIITYPSIYEGFGNQFLEGLCAKKPIAVFEYDVFLKDIKPKGFTYISLGEKVSISENGLCSIEESTLNTAVQKTASYLFNATKFYLSMNHNYNLGVKHFSLNTLKSVLESILTS